MESLHSSRDRLLNCNAWLAGALLQGSETGAKGREFHALHLGLMEFVHVFCQTFQISLGSCSS